MQTPELRGLTLAETLSPGDPSPHLTAGTVALGVLGSGVCSRPVPGDPERSALRRPGEAAVLGRAPCSGDPALCPSTGLGSGNGGRMGPHVDD